jgi:hypothetical protein
MVVNAQQHFFYIEILKNHTILIIFSLIKAG